MRIINMSCFSVALIVLLLFPSGCTKLVEVSPPINTISAAKTFDSDQTATAALIAIYNDMRYNKLFCGGGTTIYSGQSSDELDNGRGLSNPYLSNTLTAINSTAGTTFWTPAYYDIFMANAVVEGVAGSSTVTTAIKNQLTGEAKFLRAYCYFYLLNLFGDVPLVLSSDFNKTSLLSRTSTDEVYQQIKKDLTDAKNLLIADYSLSNGERIRANKWAAAALLARTYLYQKQWDSAVAQTSAVINSGSYQLMDSLNDVFLKNKAETILQLQTINASPWAVNEAQSFVPPNGRPIAVYYLDSQLVKAFEPGDMRFTHWLGFGVFSGVTYYYPYKYKVRTASPNGNITEYYVLLRLAEQYLIRAEAEAQLGDLASAINDLDTIRKRAGLPNLSSGLSREQVLAAVAQERRIELFAEWGHRWLDLKRTGQALSVLSQIPLKNGRINENQLLYPIPLTEIQTDPNLIQNPGYF